MNTKTIILIYMGNSNNLAVFELYEDIKYIGLTHLMEGGDVFEYYSKEQKIASFFYKVYKI